MSCKMPDGCVALGKVIWNSNVSDPIRYHIQEVGVADGAQSTVSGGFAVVPRNRIAGSEVSVPAQIAQWASAEICGIYGLQNLRVLSANAVAMPDAVAKAFALLADRANYPLVFHCIGGADRTGTVAFILNALLGCAEEELYLDWEVTGFKGGIVDSRHRKWFLGLVRKIGQFEGANWSEKAASYVRSCGFTDADIANILKLSANSVRDHVPAIFTKLGAANRAEAVAIALRKHLLKI